jgi:signal transduction histidine kinase
LVDAGSGEVRPAETDSSAKLARRIFGLRTILFIALTTISALPVFLLALWVERSEIERQIAAVREKHLLLASNLANTLSRYVDDVDAVFHHVVSASNIDVDPARVNSLLRSLTFRHACILDGNGKLERFITASPGAQPVSLSTEVFALLKRQAQSAGGKVIFTDIMREAGQPVFFVLKELPGDRIAVGTLATNYMIQLQESITFGKRGHTVIVDHAGNVVAHPNKDLVASSKNIAHVSIVPLMMSGKTGVEIFYSPVKKADMIAGYTVVPRTGWGVMAAQPIAELLDRAKEQVRGFAFAIATLGVVLAGLISWVLANILSRPIEAVAGTAREIAAGRPELRVPAPKATAPGELQDLAEAFNKMLDELSRKQSELTKVEMEDRAKAEFLANISHELRTPLTAIIGFTEMMRLQVLGPLGNEDYEGYVKDIHGSASHLLKMINDILDLSKAQAGFLDVRLSEVDVGQNVEFVFGMVRGRAQRSGVSLVYEADGAPKHFITDERKLRQIMLNLVSNAVKFTPRGGTVTVAVSRRSGGMRIEVRDTGIGIAADDLAKVMIPFGQVANPWTRTHDGSGLGLPLTKIITESLNGQIQLQSVVGHGTTVIIYLAEQPLSEDCSGPDRAKATAVSA